MMSSPCLLQGETLIPHKNRSIQVFYQTPPAARFLAVVSTGLGRTNDLSRLPKWLDYMSESHDYGVLLYNYAGLGKTSVRDAELSQSEQMIADLEHLLRIVAAEGWSNDQIYLVGISVGTGPTIQLLRNEGPKYRGVMLFSPYTTPKDMTGIDHRLRAFFGCDKDQIRNLNSGEVMTEVARQRTSQDITLVVGKEDETISPQHGAELYGRLKDTQHTVRLICINGASHAAVRTVARDYVRPILKEPRSITSGEERYDIQ